MAPGEAEAATCAASPSTELLLFLSLLLLGGTVDKSSKQFHLFYVPATEWGKKVFSEKC